MEKFLGTILKTGQVISGTFEKSACVTGRYIRIFDVFDKMEWFSGVSQMQLSDGEILEVYRAGGSNRLIEV